MQRIDAPTRRVAFWQWPRLAYGLAAAGILVGVTLFWWMGRQPSNDQWQQYASSNIEVYAEDLLFEEASSSTSDWLSQETEDVADELLNTIELGESGASLPSLAGHVA